MSCAWRRKCTTCRTFRKNSRTWSALTYRRANTRGYWTFSAFLRLPQPKEETSCHRFRDIHVATVYRIGADPEVDNKLPASLSTEPKRPTGNRGFTLGQTGRYANT